MKKLVMNMVYASSLTNLSQVNSSFDSGILQIAYHGENRNESSISREVFERCVKTLYNCPIVCRYDRETESIGGHDVDIVKTEDNSFKMVNLTQPVGVVPESAKTFWKWVTEEDGSEHEYLCTEVYLWKRQEAYDFLKQYVENNGSISQSMEIGVKSGRVDNGVFVIDDFEFTALALIGCEPCFESASLSFSKDDYMSQFKEMMQDLKEEFSKVNTSDEVDNTKQLNNSAKGGKGILKKDELIAKYGIDVESLDFSIDDFSAEELEEKFKAIKEVEDNEPDNTATVDGYSLSSNVLEEIRRALSSVDSIEYDWGKEPRYCYTDCDLEKCVVYCWDWSDWILYGFDYKMNGDNVEIDIESKRRMKYAIEEFDEGEQESPFASAFEKMKKSVEGYKADIEEYQVKLSKAAEAEEELKSLREYKLNKEAEIAELQRNEMFANFSDLDGIEEFEELKSNCSDLTPDAIEKECYAIRGKHMNKASFSVSQKSSPKLPVGNKENEIDEPYGGIFREYNIKKQD